MSEPTESRSKLYIKHRTGGVSQPDVDQKPPLPCCYAPPPTLWCAPLAEQNKLCETIGRVGCYGRDSRKTRRLMFIGVAANFVSLCLLFFACFAFSTNFDTIRAAGYSQGSVVLANSSTIAKLDIGMRAIAFEQVLSGNPLSPVGKYVYDFEDMCNATETTLGRYWDPEECEACHDVSTSLISTVIIALVTTLPTLFTDFQRMYPNYDMNCAKFTGTVMGLVSFCSSMYTWLGYANSCFVTFNDGLVPFYPNGTVVDDASSVADDTTIVEVDFDWSHGNGLICLILATVIKLVDLVAHALIPTPKITRDHRLQQEYEALYSDERQKVASDDEDKVDNAVEDEGAAPKVEEEAPDGNENVQDEVNEADSTTSA